MAGMPPIVIWGSVTRLFACAGSWPGIKAGLVTPQPVAVEKNGFTRHRRTGCLRDQRAVGMRGGNVLSIERQQLRRVRLHCQGQDGGNSRGIPDLNLDGGRVRVAREENVQLRGAHVSDVAEARRAESCQNHADTIERTGESAVGEVRGAPGTGGDAQIRTVDGNPRISRHGERRMTLRR